MNGINLIPAGRRQTRLRRSRMRGWIVSTLAYGGLVAAACAGSYFAWGSGYAATASQLESTGTHVIELNAKLTDLRKRIAEADSSRLTAQSLSDQPDWSILLSIISNALGQDVTLREIQLKPEIKTAAAPLTTSVTPAAQAKHFTLSLRGFAKTQPGVSQFVLRLQQIGLFDEVKLLRTGREPVQSTSAITFEISCAFGESTAAGRAAK